MNHFQKILSFTLFVLMAGCSESKQEQTDNPDLIAYYSFDNSTKDQEGVLDINSFGTTYSIGKKGNALQFGGLDSDYARMKQDKELRPNALTISMWVNIDNYQTAFTSGNLAVQFMPFIIHKNFQASSYLEGLGLGVNTVSKKITTIMGANGTTHYKYFLSTDTAHVGEWHFYTFTANVDSLILYIDGKRDNGLATGYPIEYDSAASFVLGAYRLSSFDGYLHGSMDELKIYKRVLTPIEIEELYNSYTPAKRSLSRLPKPIF